MDGEIYGSDVYLADVPVFSTDGKGNVLLAQQGVRYGEEVGTFLKAFTYNQEGLKDLRIAAKNFYTNWIGDLSEKEPLYQTIRSATKSALA